LALVLLASFVLRSLWRRWRRLRAQQASLTAPLGEVSRDPWDNLEHVWSSLRPREPWDRLAGEEFFFQLSFVLRQALELRTDLPLTGQTLSESEHSLETYPLFSANLKQDLVKFLRLAEQLKFAGAELSLDDALTWQSNVKKWLELLRKGELHDRL
jgi:hypothetical protein